MFIWGILSCEKGDVNAIANLASEANLSHVLVKIADNTVPYNLDPKTKADLVGPLVRALRARDIQVLGWHYIYGYNPAAEADRAIQLIKLHQLDGYVIDAEAEYKKPGRDQAARIFMQRLRSALPSYPIALSSYRFPSLHPHFPWKAFLEKCDLIMPQVYWLYAHNPAEQIIRCVREFESMVPHRPVFPTGSAFKQGKWAPTLDDLTKFMDTSKSLNLAGVNYWEWSNCRRHLPEAWDLIKQYQWIPNTGSSDISHRYINALNNRKLDELIAMYNPSAVHITSQKTIQGISAIKSWFTQLFSQILPDGNFSLSGVSGQGVFRNLSWTATSSKGQVLDGKDTIGLANNQIAFHYSSFSVNKS
jgi:hypothetical protein